MQSLNLEAMAGYTSITKRPADLTLAIIFFVKAVLAIFSDYINAVGTHHLAKSCLFTCYFLFNLANGLPSNAGPSNTLTKEAVMALCETWPPRWFCDIFWDGWIPKDPLLLQNPVWLKWVQHRFAFCSLPV
jgi:hypothetical protein